MSIKSIYFYILVTCKRCKEACLKEKIFNASEGSLVLTQRRKWEREQLIHCQSLKLVIHPIWPVDAVSLLPCHSLVIQTQEESRLSSSRWRKKWSSCCHVGLPVHSSYERSVTPLVRTQNCLF